MKKCSKNCQGCNGTDDDKISCPEWIIIEVVSNIFKDLRKIQSIISQAMINDLHAEVKNEIMEDDDDLEETYAKAEKDLSHNRFFN